ncbi:hypothetical protein NE857_33830 (plasmid) [Nocardiopsis exhalans]|uniref:Uncharacterized protein n=1 Tax=Nocardiopsis exhalans TaxID=163604 RepID=A0ABY5DGZ7_9ACTN|nr:hypothetical protein [Nocardiopsis exhalans]USY23612.1 hypothetical protein NE857_33830 [Nocardiopsis exhalans]
MSTEVLHHAVVTHLSAAALALVDGDAQTANTRLDQATHGTFILKAQGAPVQSLAERLDRLHSRWETMQG